MSELLTQTEISKSRVEFLVRSGTQSELQDNLDSILEWVDDDVVSWEPIGGVVNTDVFGNLTDSMTALVENVTNSSDAYLLQEYDGGEYRNCFEAADSVLDPENHRVKMRFDGDKPSSSSEGFSITFSDSAHGQPKNNFDVFVNPLETGLSKQEYSFLQGCRGVGSITALGHTQDGYKFIASASDEDPEEWTWTVIRSGNQNGYYYLTIDGEFPTFTGTFDCGSGIGEKTHGTVVKLYNYDLPTNPKDAAHGSVFTRELSRYIPEPVVPIEICDVRYDEDSTRVFSGVDTEIQKNSEAFETNTFTEDVFGIGDVETSVYVGKPQNKREQLVESGDLPENLGDSLSRYFTTQSDKRVLVCVNGQTHHSYSTSELRKNSSLENASQKSLVVVNLLDNQSTVGESLFNSGRTGFSDTTAKQRLESAVIESIGNSEAISEVDNEHKDESTTEETNPKENVTITRSESGEVQSVHIQTDSSDDTEVITVDDTSSTTTMEETSSTDVTSEELVEQAAKTVDLTVSNTDELLDNCFKQMVSSYQSDTDKDMTDFQSVASNVGSVFEAYFEYVVETLYPSVTVERDVELPNSAMVGTGSADAVLYESEEKETIKAIIELKGNPQTYTNLQNEIVHTASCSGLQRSDTVKKAVCQGYQAKQGYPDVPFFVVSNTLPAEGTSPDTVLSFAEGDLIDEVVDITDSESVQNVFNNL